MNPSPFETAITTLHDGLSGMPFAFGGWSKGSKSAEIQREQYPLDGKERNFAAHHNLKQCVGRVVGWIV